MGRPNDQGVFLKRRRFIAGASAGTGLFLTGLDHPELHSTGPSEPEDGELLGALGFLNEGPVEMDATFGSELDGRLFTNLSHLGRENLVTPESRFYLRTRASRILPDAGGWKIAVHGLVAAKKNVGMEELHAMEKPLGLHLMECAGNTRAAHFGMISVGEWRGVPVTDLLAALQPSGAARRVLISGFDKYVTNSVTSTPGASWIFTLDELKLAGAFLATQLDGMPLSRDHGAPVRLVVPGWYGCTCIKWVDEIRFVDETAEATSQMTEYASRTHQSGSPRLAREFAPARIDPAAMPIRVEKRRIGGGIRYRVVGLLWGGNETVRALGIRFNPEEDYVRVEALPVPQTGPWTLWTHNWSPASKGTYTIRLKVLEPTSQTRRLDSGYYARSVEIEEV